ncbi:MAG: DUF1223 domain-containing protein [Pseudomonadota bacterium]
MPRALVLTLAVLAGSAVAAAEPAPPPAPRAFLELFTSQGCAACPKADAMIEELSSEPGVMAVSMPVTLWDFFGWADTLALESATKRQMDYSVARSDRDVFTPQMVVNGRQSVLGSDGAAIKSAIPEDALPLPIGLSAAGDVLRINVPASAEPFGKVTLHLIVARPEMTVPIKGGENSGRTLTYHNVVRHIRSIGMYDGDALSMAFPLSDIEKAPGTICYVVAQVSDFKGPGRIIGAAMVGGLFPARTVSSQ